MKKTILIFALVSFAVSYLQAEGLPNDTTFQYNRKYITVEEGDDQFKVKIFETNDSSDTIQYKQLYEGIFSDEKTYEKWTVQEAFGFDIPLPFVKKKKKNRYTSNMDSHREGIGLGFANIADQSFNMTDVDGISLNAGSSYEWFFNLFGTTIPLYRNNLGITTAAGMSWLNLRLNNYTRLADMDGVTRVYPVSEDIGRYSLSRLMVVRINIPLLLECQLPNIGGKHRAAFVSAGVVGGVKTFASYKVKYEHPSGRRPITEIDRGLNIAPLFLDYMVQAGYGSLSVYAKYSPIGLFQTNKGPDVRAVSLGLILHFD